MSYIDEMREAAKAVMGEHKGQRWFSVDWLYWKSQERTGIGGQFFNLRAFYNMCRAYFDIKYKAGRIEFVALREINP